MTINTVLWPLSSSKNLRKICLYRCLQNYNDINSSSSDRIQGLCENTEGDRPISIISSTLDTKFNDNTIATVRKRKVAQRTLLHIACEKGQLQCAQILLETKASPNVKARGLPSTTSGETPLHLAAHYNHEPCVQLLLEAKVSLF